MIASVIIPTPTVWSTICKIYYRPVTVSESMNKAEIQKNNLIHARIAQEVADHPALKSIASKIPGMLSLTPKFLKAYVASDVHYTVKSLLVRALLEDPTVYKKVVLGPLTCGSIRRMSEYFINHRKIAIGAG